MSLTEQKVKEVLAELSEWLEKEVSKEDLTKNGIEKIQKKLTEPNIVRSIINGFESVNRWYSNLFVFESLKDGITKHKMAASSGGYEIIILFEKFFPLYPNNPQAPSFEYIAFYLANCLSEKWYKDSEEILVIINKGLDTNFLKRGWEIKSTAWFIIEMASKGFGINVDYKKYNYPKDMGVYAEALDIWNTTDLNKLDNVISKLCDFHLDQASYGDISDDAGRNDPMFLQFSTTKEFVYCYEILAWLSIREKIGLKNPESFSHPLMNLALNKLPATPSVRPVNELFEAVLAKLK